MVPDAHEGHLYKNHQLLLQSKAHNYYIIYDILLEINSSILHRFGDIASRSRKPPHLTLSIVTFCFIMRLINSLTYLLTYFRSRVSLGILSLNLTGKKLSNWDRF